MLHATQQLSQADHVRSVIRCHAVNVSSINVVKVQDFVYFILQVNACVTLAQLDAPQSSDDDSFSELAVILNVHTQHRAIMSRGDVKLD